MTFSRGLLGCNKRATGGRDVKSWEACGVGARHMGNLCTLLSVLL